ncbi:MAG TPA: GGDEF domain-containing protein [Thermoleophilaceae bacterium]
MDSAGSWLCPTEEDRARALEAGDRVRRARTIAAAAIATALVASAPWVGWWTLPLMGLCALELLSLDRRMARSKKPEWLAARAQLSILLLLAVGVALDKGVYGVALPWLVIPVAMSATRFRGHVVMVGAAITALAMVLSTVPFDPQAVIDDPTPLGAALVLLIAVTAITNALARGEIKSRGQAILDPLTGLLNRAALETRVLELEQQAQLTGGAVALVLVDLDRFKRVNDTYGHNRGDAVLRDVAYEIRKSLRSFELVYRIGGEEFLIVLPGIGIDEATEIAERVRRSIAEARPGEVELTLSAGVACAAGEAMTYDEVFRAADAALFEAKREGRNRVLRADGLVALPVPDARRIDGDAAPASLS